MRRLAIAGTTLALLAGGAAIAASDVHVCVAADGSVTYTNMPCRSGRQQAMPTPRPLGELDEPTAAAPTPEPRLPTVVLQPTPARRSTARAPAADTPACHAARAAYRAAPRETFADGFEVKRRLERVRDTCAGSSPAAGAFDANTGEFYMLQGDQLVEPAQGRALVR